MEALDKIYVSRPVYNQCGLVISEDKPVEYIRKDLLLEWAKEQEVDAKLATTDGIYYSGREHAFHELIDKLNSL